MLIDGNYVSHELLPVVTGSYLAFNAGIPSDHRALWIDLPGVVSGFGKAYTPTKSNTWQLQCKDPHVLMTYLQKLSQQLSVDNLLSWAANLTALIKL